MFSGFISYRRKKLWEVIFTGIYMTGKNDFDQMSSATARGGKRKLN